MRMPAWRAEIQNATAPPFLDLCEAYDLTWDRLARSDAQYLEEYRELADGLENEALLLALAAAAAKG